METSLANRIGDTRSSTRPLTAQNEMQRFEMKRNETAKR